MVNLTHVSHKLRSSVVTVHVNNVMSKLFLLFTKIYGYFFVSEAPIIEWYLPRLVVMNEHQKDTCMRHV